MIVVVPLYIVVALSAFPLIRRYEPWSYVTLTAAFLPLLCSLLGFAFIDPAFIYLLNTLAWLEIPLTMVVATGIAGLPTVWLRSAVFALLLAVNLAGLNNYYHTDHVRLDLLADRMAQDLRPGDAAIAVEQHSASCAVRYYLVRSHVQPPPGIRDACTDSQDRIDSPGQAQRYQRIWALTVPDDQLPFDPSAPPLGYVKAYETVAGDVHLQRFDKPGEGK